MSNLRRFTLSSGLAALLAVGAGATAIAGSGEKDHKVTLCHWAAHKYVEINVAVASMNAHMAHGDIAVDDYGECP